MATPNSDQNAPTTVPATQTNGGLPAASGQSSTDAPDAIEAQLDTPLQRGVERFKGLPRTSQYTLLIVVVSLLAIVIVSLLWSTEKNYKLLYGKLSDEVASQIVDILKQQQIPYKFNEHGGELLIPADKVYETRLMLAAKGLPKNEGSGFEMLDKKQSFGTSQFMETARYNHAMEGEIARSIARLQHVEGARVHLALPKQSVFVRDRQPSSASVLITLSPGHRLSDDQVAAIIHLVASSVPQLAPERVTVVDQTGKMLTKSESSGDLSLTSAQFEHKKALEQYYIERIERILTPIVGFEAVRAQVDATVDYSITEQTAESFNPDVPALRSEQTQEEISKGGEAGGVPGALTNQPPGAANSPEKINTDAGGNAKTEAITKQSKRATYNYELDKTVSHTRRAPGVLNRISAAVVVDDKFLAGVSEGTVARAAYTPEEMERIVALVKEAIGFNVQRGDSVTVTNASFMSPELMIPRKKEIWYELPWVGDIAKLSAAALLSLLVILFVLRPVAKALIKKDAVPPLPGADGGPEAVAAGHGGLSIRDVIDYQEITIPGFGVTNYEELLSRLRDKARAEPKVVAQIIKVWVAEGESA
ncbi:MAG: flagellar basal-body MS-ring/collar protein FliF [Pseudomonadota bacterium]